MTRLRARVELGSPAARAAKASSYLFVKRELELGQGFLEQSYVL